MAVKLRKSANSVLPGDATAESPTPVQLRPLEIVGVCVTKEALIASLRVFVPNLVDIESIEGDQRFLLSFGPPGEGVQSLA